MHGHEELLPGFDFSDKVSTSGCGSGVESDLDKYDDGDM